MTYLSQIDGASYPCYVYLNFDKTWLIVVGTQDYAFGIKHAFVWVEIP